jgi:hypothetical protein
MIRGIKKKIHRDYCEVCGNTDKSTLIHHHIIERKQLNTSNDPFNLAVLCSNCHAKIHRGDLKIIAVLPSTKPPAGRMLVYVIDGKQNIEYELPVEKKTIGLKISS